MCISKIGKMIPIVWRTVGSIEKKTWDENEGRISVVGLWESFLT